MLTHVHYCKYCDCAFDCTDTGCGLFYELKRHACGERQDFQKALRFRLGEVCKYNCNKPCNHPMKFQRQFEEVVEYAYMRPKVERLEPKLDEDGNSYRNHFIYEPGSKTKHSEECVCKACTLAYRKGEHNHA
jgi:hypothetical protein